jgi:hypothetical protein
MKKKPYIKKIKDISGFHVWYVNGFWIRRNLDEEFTNFGQHYQFDFIPKNELWIDQEQGKKETKYFIGTMLLMNQLHLLGHTRKQINKIATHTEIAERNKSKSILKLKSIRNKEIVFKKIRKEFLKKYSKNIKVYLVRGDLIRSLFYTDFTQGGHDMVYKFVPKNEVWIDDDLFKKERVFVIIHELFERYHMAKGMSYDKAHEMASALEYKCRKNPKIIEKTLKLQIKRNKVF